MKDLTKEIKKAAILRDSYVWNESELLHYLINKRRYEFVYDYLEGKEIVFIDNGNPYELLGVLHGKFPLGFIHEKAYDDFRDLNFYHLVKVKSFDKIEWKADLQELKHIAPEINWLCDEEAVNPNGFSINDFVFATM
jgi:hypothetical protein